MADFYEDAWRDGLFGRGPDDDDTVVLFAGIGGACLGIQAATGRSPWLAANHWDFAIATHAINHPDTYHCEEDLLKIEPRRAARGRRVSRIWASPKCTHHSRAAGGVPRSEQERIDGWVVVDWARELLPDELYVENVPEWEKWGPLGDDGRPIKARAGETFLAWCAALRDLGYALEWRCLRACDYGVPTTRERLYLVARRDGKPIRWPDPTHGPGRLPYRTAAECVDFDKPMCSIFATPAEARAWSKKYGTGVPKRPLEAATCRRIAEGVMRFVVNSKDPFLLTLSHGGRLRPLNRPFPTLTAEVKGGEIALVAPVLDKMYGSARAGQPVTEPMPTVTSGGDRGGHHVALVGATLVQTGYGEREGQRPRALDIGAPLGTVVGGGQKHALVAAWVARHNGTTDGKENPGSDLNEPQPTVCAGHNQGLCVAALSKEATDNAEKVAAFIVEYYGQGGQHSKLSEPMNTATTTARFGLVTVQIDGETWVVTDICMRMLEPEEYLAAMGFPKSFRWPIVTPAPKRSKKGTIREQPARAPSKKDMIKGIGNAVCPAVAEALVRANCESGARKAA